jgi:uncharacterized protein (DUF1015 family)
LVEIRPFRAIKYAEKAGDLKNLITQPYDKIDRIMQEKYYERSVYNYCRLILPREDNRYEIANQRIQKWLREGILSKEQEAAVFVSRQEFRFSGRTLRRTGLIAAVRLHRYEERVVFPHEVTYGEPKADRLNMMRAVNKDLEPVFLIYSDHETITINFFEEVTKSKPTIELEDSFGVKHTIWKVTSPRKINLIQRAMENKKLVITDGHHRYESALIYRDERRKKEKWAKDSAFNFHMCYMVPIQEEGLVVLPTHRLLKKYKLTKEILDKIGTSFRISELNPSVEGLETFLDAHADEHAFVIYNGVAAQGLVLNNKNIVSQLVGGNTSQPKEVLLPDVIILRDLVFQHIMNVGKLRIDENILYSESISNALEKVDAGQADLAFLVNATNPGTVWQIAQRNWRLPEKSTDFYPKPVSGLLMMDIQAKEILR